MRLLKPICALALALIFSALSGNTARANNVCSWWDPWDKVTYNGVSVSTNGGSSLSNTVGVVIEFWGAAYNNQSGALYTGEDVHILETVPTMLNDSAFWSRYSQYGVTSGSVQGVYYDFGSLSDATISESWIQTELGIEINHQTVPFPSNLVYLIFLPTDLVSRAGEGTGFHGATTVTIPSLPPFPFPYAVVQQAVSAGCQGCTDSAMSRTAAHEVMEASTDPFGSGWFDAPPPAGSAHPGNTTLEIGDLCNGIGEQVNGVWWQQSWLQDQCRCDGEGTPVIFWPQTSGYTGEPIGDWMFHSFKGQCSPGQPVTGISAPTTENSAHAILCGNGPSYANTYPQDNGCHALAFDPLNNPVTWTDTDWAPGFYKAECASNEYVAGVSQTSNAVPGTTAGQVDGILCCPGNVSANSCTTETLLVQNSASYTPPDWDPGFL